MRDTVLINEMLFLVPDEQAWDRYKHKLSHSSQEGHVIRHFGIPVEFPCLVTSFCSDEVDNTTKVDHRFVYIVDASFLLDIKRKLKGRSTI